MAFVGLDDLEDRIDLELSEQEQRMVEAKLEDASIMARHHSGLNWPDDKAPGIVKVIVLNVVARWILNPDGLIQSRAGDETLVYSDRGETGSFYFTRDEIVILESLGKPRQSLGSIGTYAYRSGRPAPDIDVHIVRPDGLAMGADLYPWLSQQDAGLWSQ